MSDQTNLNDLDDDEPSDLNDVEEEDEGGPSTEKPLESYGFLEQFETLSRGNIDTLEEVVTKGITPHERMILIRVSLRLLGLSAFDASDDTFKEYPEYVSEIETLLLNLNMLPQYMKDI